MHIAIYHDALIPPQKYGGTERIIYWLSKALMHLGHRISLIAQPGSFIPGAEIIPYSNRTGRDWRSLVPNNADFLHLWATPRSVPTLPFLVTIEGNGKVGEIFHPNTVFVSGKHAEIHGSPHFVYNGIDPGEYEFDLVRENYAVFLAKASWKVKNLLGAIEVAKNAHTPLYVMGSRDWPFQLQRYLNRFSKKVHYLGMVGDIEKKAILKKARALLFPVRWNEPFGIAVTEALASGCPVLGTPYGSLPEIVTQKTGVLSSDANELTEALMNKNFSPLACRQRVYQGFTHIEMAEHYLRYYEKILIQGSLEPNESTTQSTYQGPPEQLLPWKSRSSSQENI